MIRACVLAPCLAGALMLGQSPAAASGPAPALELAQAAAITAPSTVDPGSVVTVTVPGARADGRVELWGPVTETGRGARIDGVPAADTVSIAAPMRPGSYELRYVGPGGDVRARATLDVAAVPVTLEVPEKMSAGLDVRVRWQGPARPGDMLQIVDPASGRVVSEVPAVGAPGDRMETEMRAPEALGAYRLRYWSASREAMLRSLPVEVIRGNAWLRSPLTVRAGETFEAEWNGPVSREQEFRVVDPLTDTVLTTKPGGESATLTAPTRTGSYRVRYVNTETGFTHADLPLTVTPR